MNLTTKNLTNFMLKGVMACAVAILGANAYAQETLPPNIAIDILLQPDATMLKHVAAINDLLRRDYPKGFALDASHRPHVTMAQRYVRVTDLDKVYAAVGKVLTSYDMTGLKLEAYKYYYIPDKELGLQGIVVKPTPELLKLQQEVIDAVTPFAVKKGTVAAFVPPTDGSFIDPLLVEYVEFFVPKHSGQNYMPHVTTGLATKDYLDKMAAEPFKTFTFSPTGAAVYHLGNYGTATTKLHVFKLTP